MKTVLAVVIALLAVQMLGIGEAAISRHTKTNLPSTVTVTAQKETTIQRLTRQVNNLKKFQACFTRVLPVAQTVPGEDGTSYYVVSTDDSTTSYVPLLKEGCVQ